MYLKDVRAALEYVRGKWSEDDSVINSSRSSSRRQIFSTHVK